MKKIVISMLLVFGVTLMSGCGPKQASYRPVVQNVEANANAAPATVEEVAVDMATKCAEYIAKKRGCQRMGFFGSKVCMAAIQDDSNCAGLYR